MNILEKISKMRKPFAQVVTDGRNVSLKFMGALELQKELRERGGDFGLFIAADWFIKLCGLLYRQGFTQLGLDLGFTTDDMENPILKSPAEVRTPADANLIITYYKKTSRAPLVPTGYWTSHYEGNWKDGYKRVRKWVEPKSKTPVPHVDYPGTTEATLETAFKIRKTVRADGEHRAAREWIYEEQFEALYRECMEWFRKNQPENLGELMKMSKKAVVSQWLGSGKSEIRRNSTASSSHYYGGASKSDIIDIALNGRRKPLDFAGKIIYVRHDGMLCGMRRIA